MKKIILPAVFLLVTFISTATNSIATFKLIPSVSVREEYNDNLFLSDSNEDDDFITTIFPKIEFQYEPNSKLDLILEYGLQFNFYSDHSDLNDTSLRETQNIDFRAHASPLNHVFINVSDVYEKVQVDVRDPVAEDNVFFNKTERNTFFVTPYVTFPITPSFSSTAGYAYTNIWHRDDLDEFSDSENHYAYVSLNKRFSAKIEGILRYGYEMFRPEDARDSGIYEYDRQEASTGFVYRPNSRAEISGEIGEAWTDYEGIDDQYEGTFWNINGSYDFGVTTVGGGYELTFEDSPTSGSYKRQRVFMNFETGRGVTMSAEPYYLWNDYINIGREDKITGISLSLSRNVTQKIDAEVDGLAEKQKFLPEDRKVNRYSLGGRLNYRARRNITATIGYRYNTTDSDDGVGNYDNNIAWLQAEVFF